MDISALPNKKYTYHHNQNPFCIFQVVIEVHNEQDPDKQRPSSLQQLQEMLDLEPQKLENINQNTMDGNIPQEKDGFLSRKVGYEIERRLVKAVQVRTLRKKREKKGHYHYYPFYEKSSNYNGFWGWLKHHLSGILIIKLFSYKYVAIWILEQYLSS